MRGTDGPGEAAERSVIGPPQAVHAAGCRDASPRGTSVSVPQFRQVSRTGFESFKQHRDEVTDVKFSGCTSRYAAVKQLLRVIQVLASGTAVGACDNQQGHMGPDIGGRIAELRCRKNILITHNLFITNVLQ